MTHDLFVQFTKRYGPDVAIKADFQLVARSHLITALFGPSGCGKTSTLRCVAGLERPDEGWILWQGDTWFDAKRRICRSPQQRNIGYLFQDDALFPHLTVAANISYGIGRLSSPAIRRQVMEFIECLHLTGLEDRYPRQLSGGERRRVALARTLACKPRLLLLDEPLSAVDGPTRDQLLAELKPLLSRIGVPVILVTHDRREAMVLADQILVMHQGCIRQAGSPADVFSRPNSYEVALIVGMETIQPGQLLEMSGTSATIGVGSVRIRAVTDRPLSSSINLCVRAEMVGLGTPPSGNLNQWTADIRDVRLEGPMVRVDLDCGFPLVARLTLREWQRLGLAVGMKTTAWISPLDVICLPVPSEKDVRPHKFPSGFGMAMG